ncbi:hypothetical protein [Nocardia sp. NPDC057440]|uniref:hypothetical protein n=1 Tax=Nocardia sp. NPDC057440 TaxID=3346134 RepID=UPI0036715E11
MKQLSRQAIEEVVGPVGDWQWALLRTLMTDPNAKPIYIANSRGYVKRRTERLFLEGYRSMGYRVEEVPGVGHRIYLPGEESK